jgi:uncharacterized YccA/Bax inhibitor family protein
MTVEGATNKSLFLLALLIVSAIGTVTAIGSNPDLGFPMMIGGAVIGFILAIVTSFKANWSPVLAPAYAVAVGLVIGSLSLMYENVYKGIVLNAAVGTVGILLVMLTLYRTGIVRATPMVTRAIIFATLGIGIIYLVDIVMMSFFHTAIPMIHDSGPIGILFSVVVCGIAAFNLILDFNFIEQGAQSGAPKFMEWYAGFTLLVTLVWLYLEVLRLLSKLNSRS